MTPAEVATYHPPCDLCQGVRFQPIARRDRHGQPLRTVVCRDCGLVRHWRVPSDEELSAFYRHQYRQAYHGEATPSPRRIMRAWGKAERIYHTLAAHLGSAHHVFEVGAGIGCTVKYFQHQGHAAAGLEPHAGFQRFAVEKLRANVLHRDVFTHHDRGRQDLVLLVHVIEHFRSPRLALQQIRPMLAEGGLLYVECPDLEAHFRFREGMFHYAHIHNFTRATLGALAERCGYRVAAWLHPGREPNLCVLLAADAGANRLALPNEGYATTLQAMGRYNWWTYHARYRYLDHRVRKVAGYLTERLTGRRFVARLLDQCAHDPLVDSSRLLAQSA